MKRLMASGVLMVVLAAGARRRRPGRACTRRPRGDSIPIASGRTWRHCESWAHQQTGFDPAAETAKGAVVGAVVGGALGAGGGAALGAASGGSAGRGAATGAVLGGVVGGVAGGAIQYSRSKEGFDRAYASCMNARGYYTGPAVAMAPAAAPGAGGGRAAAAAGRRRPPAAARHRDSDACRRGRTPARSHPAGSLSAPGYCRLWYPGRPPASSRIRFPATGRSRFPRARSSSTRAPPGTVTTTGVRTRGVSRGRCPR